MNVRTRFAPSPTGLLHIGGIRTALFSWLHARHCDGEFLLRIEDTDRARSTDEAVQVIIDGMRWLDLYWDGEVHFQSRRGDRYREIVQRLLESGNAYRCYCTREDLDAMRAEALSRGEKPRYNGRCRDGVPASRSGGDSVIRFRNPRDGAVNIHDLIQGGVTYQNAELDDLIIARTDGSPTYNLTVVVDDLDMAITHVIRGDDHLNNTPRQINIFRALDWQPPAYAHIPLILGPDGAKLSKRHGTVSVLQYRQEGFLADALLNYLVRLGWSHGDKEIFSREEMIGLFDIAEVNKSAAAINPEKLLWLNQHYLKHAEDSRVAPLLREQLLDLGLDVQAGPGIEDVVAVQKLRTKTLREMAEQSRFLYQEHVTFDEAAAAKHLVPGIVDALAILAGRFSSVRDWSDDGIKAVIAEVAEEAGVKVGKLAQPLRVAVTGSGVSPSIEDTVRLLGQQRTIARLRVALEFIRARSARD